MMRWLVRRLWRLIIAGMVAGVFALTFFACWPKQPIRVGFVSQLTGAQSEMGVQQRNGVLLAVERINAAGGISGRRLELLVRDDLGTAEGARAADLELIEAGVVAIIGHATSGQTVAGVQVTNGAGVIMLSPTTSTEELSRREDLFFRITPTVPDRAVLLADHIYRRRGLSRIAVLSDAGNASFTQSCWTAFSSHYRSLGGSVAGEAAFSAKERPDLVPILAALRATGADGLLILASGTDTAHIAQRVRLLGWQVPLFASGWAQTEELITQGGQAVEGLEIEEPFPISSPSPALQDFKERYQARFGRVACFSAAFGYESVYVLAEALRATGGRAAGLPKALLDIRDFPGLVDPVSFDPYGDVVRPSYLGVIRGGQFVELEISQTKQQ